jgi:hypothetical protein
VGAPRPGKAERLGKDEDGLRTGKSLRQSEGSLSYLLAVEDKKTGFHASCTIEMDG